jgi:hypothetical protein
MKQDAGQSLVSEGKNLKFHTSFCRLTLFFPQIPPQNLLALHLQEDSLSAVKHVPPLNGQLEGLVGIPAEAASCPLQEMYMPAYVVQSHAVHIA